MAFSEIPRGSGSWKGVFASHTRISGCCAVHGAVNPDDGHVPFARERCCTLVVVLVALPALRCVACKLQLKTFAVQVCTDSQGLGVT